jgi:hypothetical protein
MSQPRRSLYEIVLDNMEGFASYGCGSISLQFQDVMASRIFDAKAHFLPLFQFIS